MSVKTNLCSYSGERLYPGHGFLYVRSDGRVLRFASGKSESKYSCKVHRRKVAWTQFYRKINSKGDDEEQQGKRRRRKVKTQRDYRGLTVQQIEAKKAAAKTVASTSSKKTAIRAAKKAKTSKSTAPKTFGSMRSRGSVYQKHNLRASVRVVGGH